MHYARKEMITSAPEWHHNHPDLLDLCCPVRPGQVDPDVHLVVPGLHVLPRFVRRALEVVPLQLPGVGGPHLLGGLNVLSRESKMSRNIQAMNN